LEVNAIVRGLSDEELRQKFIMEYYVDEGGR